jgi:hypothetical protein
MPYHATTRRETMTEREKFMTRLAEARAAGLVDMKFFFHPARALEPEEIFAAMNEIEDAIDAGKCVRHTSWEVNNVAHSLDG